MNSQEILKIERDCVCEFLNFEEESEEDIGCSSVPFLMIIKNVHAILPTQIIASCVISDDTFAQVLPFTLNMLTNKAIAIEQSSLFRRLCTKQS